MIQTNAFNLRTNRQRPLRLWKNTATPQPNKEPNDKSLILLFTCMREVIYGHVPSKSNGYRIISIGGRGSLTKTKELKQYEKDFDRQIVKYRNKQIEWFALDIDVYLRSNRSDLDGTFKSIFDCLQISGAIVNDNKCVMINARKYIDKDNPRIDFEIIEMREPEKVSR